MAVNFRHVVGQTVFHKHDADSGVTKAGSFMTINGDGTVAKVTTSGQAPVGFLATEVVSPIPGLPAGHQFPAEKAGSSVLLGEQVLMYNDGGTMETDVYHYAVTGTAGIPANTVLYAEVNDSTYNGYAVNDDGSNVDVATDEGGDAVPVARVVESITHEEALAGKSLVIKLLI